MNEDVYVLGYKVSRLGMSETVVRMEAFIAAGGFHRVVLGNIYCAILSRRDSVFREVSNSADLSVADGMSLVWASHVLREPVPEKVSGWDLFEVFCALAASKGYSCFMLGGGPGGAEKVAEALKRKYAALKIVGIYSPELGPIDDHENDRILEMINAASPDVLWVGLGSPRQEIWLWRNRHRLRVRVAAGIGSAFDHQMGRQKRAPRWMQQLGLEWLHRPTQDPSLLWRKRYDRYFPCFVFPVLYEGVRRRLLGR